MSGFSSFDLVEASIWNPRMPSFSDFELEDHALDLLNPCPNPSPFDLLPFFETTYDLIHIPSPSAIRRLQERTETELYLRSLSDRVTALETGFDRAFAPKKADFDRKYTWTTEIKGEKVDRKFKWSTEAKAGEEKNFKWTAEIKGKGKDENKSKIYSFQASTAKGKIVNKEKEKKKEEKKEKKKDDNGVKLVEIEEKNPGAIAIRKAFSKYQSKGKRKELSPQDAAVIIQMTYRSYLVRRSLVVHCLRDLAVAKAKLKEIRAMFYNFSYRRRLTNDAEERQRFSEKIIVLLLTVDAIEGPDYMVRAARKSMAEELEYMLEVVDPQPPGKLGSLRRRNFDLPVGAPISKAMSRGVADVVQMLDEDEDSSV
ncbi:uncharacterized protein A4U43_C08F2370 [Asparagus officinalis]|uniref:BAG family molecular chaperone regulator 7 n=1 Tax=Asparagus officinalis TaxID=4686 RepID=UPI00098E59CB|nr:BAG family molecular chaperone regulator 7 [Asparagus officinalis]ONK59042.1 uncharacterized protein A4U43_C08F2370 [Asparagus officinalis]